MPSILDLKASISTVLNQIPIDFGGGCSIEKGTVMAWIIARERIKRSIDLGVYRGRSLFPQAIGHKSSGGRVYGIDPWSADEAREFDHPEIADQINDFIDKADWDTMFGVVSAQQRTFALERHIHLIRATGDAAVSQLAGKSFGLIHIDGNHDTEHVVSDVKNYLPLLEPENGFLVLDDISWTSVKPATDMVRSTMTLLYARVDTMNDYAVFWNGTSPAKKSRLRKAIALAGED